MFPTASTLTQHGLSIPVHNHVPAPLCFPGFARGARVRLHRLHASKPDFEPSSHAVEGMFVSRLAVVGKYGLTASDV